MKLEKMGDRGAGMAGEKMFIVGPEGVSAFALRPSERLERQGTRYGVKRVFEPEAADLILRADRVLGTRLFGALVEAEPGTLLVDADNCVVAARVDGASRGWALSLVERCAPASDAPAEARVMDARSLAGEHSVLLRKKAPPLLLKASEREAVERALFEDAYKGVTDFVTKHIWPPAAFLLTRWCAQRGISPNHVTLVGTALMLLAFWLFWQGQFAVGLIVAWLMCLLDTVDGKLARVTVRSSRIGNVLDHGVDLIHPPFWYWAWAVGCERIGQPLDDGGLTLAIIIGGYVIQRIQEGLFLWAFDMEIHVWRRFDSLFRQITARRNPNLAILTIAAALGYPREGLIAVAAWTAISTLVHLVRLIQAFAARCAGEQLRSWLAAA